ncbi:unnamed protein product [Dicrocoelium dendriticum]|nr:unnamed protein product [Dicrocoelium dendriticum]
MPSSNQAKLNHCVSQSARQKLKRPKGTVSPAVVTSATPVIPPPPSLTKTDPAHSAAAHAPDVFTHTHKFARRRRSIPLLLPQPPSIPCSPSSPSRSPSETPPVLRRLDENIDVVPIPPPPPLLPMHNPCSSTLDVPYVMHFSTSSSAASSNSGNSPLLQRTHSQFHDSHSLVFHPQMRSKSMHASLQDLIAEEFSKQSSYSGEYITMCPSRALPDQPKLATSSLVHQLTLPPRKRIWNLNDAEKPVSSPKHSRQDSPKFAQLSPPTLSPIEPKSSLTSRSSCNGLSTAFSCDASDALNMPPPPLVPTSEEWHRSNPPLLQDQPTLPSISLLSFQVSLEFHP